MKNLLAFTAFLAAGFLLGSRRARKAGPISVMPMRIEIEANTSQALSSLKLLQAQAVKTTDALSAADRLTSQFQQRYASQGKEPGRATGQTTRQIDAAIQTLFTAGEVTVRDHIDRRANHQLVYEKVVARLKLEHRREQFVFLDHSLKILLPKFGKA